MLLSLVSKLLLPAAYARPPDVQTAALVSRVRSGALAPGDPDVLVWTEQETGRLSVTELTGGQLTTQLVAHDITSVTALLDYDGDGQNNILCSLGGGVKVDIETEQIFDIPTCGSDGVGDVDGDGFDDLMSPFEAWLGSPSGFAAGGALYAEEDTSSCPTVHALGDIDGDGRGDFARASISWNPPYFGNDVYGTMDLYLGATYSTPTFSPYWRYRHPTEGAGMSVVAADVDGDRQSELVIVAGHNVDGLVRGELQLLDDVFDPLGPSALASSVLSPLAGNHWGYTLHDVGDIDGDGDAELLFVMEDMADETYLRILDAEPTEMGLAAVVGDSFELPLPEGVDESDTSTKIVMVGDYDGDGWRDVAMMLSYNPPEDDYSTRGVIAMWLHVGQTLPAPLPVELPEASTTATTPPATTPPTTAPPAPLSPSPEAKAAYTCGCNAWGAGRGAAHALLLLPLLFARRSR